MHLPTTSALLLGASLLYSSHAQKVDKTDAGNKWIMPDSFSLNETTSFYWLIQPGVNVLSMEVRPESNPNEGIQLPLGPCQIQQARSKCTQYTNNGTATFGGSYAAGLSVTESYFISINWTTVDGSKTGVESSPSFSIVDPNAPTPTTSSTQEKSSTSSDAATSGIESTQTTVIATAASTRTIHLSLVTPTTSSTLSTASNTPSPIVAITTPSPTPTPEAKQGSSPLTTGAKVGIAVGSVAVVGLILFALLLWIRRRGRNKAEYEKDIIPTYNPPSYGPGELHAEDSDEMKRAVSGVEGMGLTAVSAPPSSIHKSIGTGVKNDDGVVAVAQVEVEGSKRASMYELDSAAAASTTPAGEPAHYRAYSPEHVAESYFPPTAKNDNNGKGFVVQA